MRKLQKMVLGMVSLSMLFLTATTAFATSAPQRVPARKCSKCSVGTVYDTSFTVCGSPYSSAHVLHEDTVRNYTTYINEYCDNSSCTYRVKDKDIGIEVLYCPDDK